MTRDPQCESCRFWKRGDKVWAEHLQEMVEDTNGECRRYPPVAAMTQKQQDIACGQQEEGGVYIGMFPLTMSVEWCGEYQPFSLAACKQCGKPSNGRADREFCSNRCKQADFRKRARESKESAK